MKIWELGTGEPTHECAIQRVAAVGTWGPSAWGPPRSCADCTPRCTRLWPRSGHSLPSSHPWSRLILGCVHGVAADLLRLCHSNGRTKGAQPAWTAAQAQLG